MRSKIFNPAFAFIFFILITVWVYLPGAGGDFLFDDYHNLDAMGNLGGVVDWDTFRAFVFNGWSGPTGRPLSLLSFLLDDNTWPSYAPWFKTTNILIHLLCGALLCWAVLLLMRNLKSVSEQQAQWIAVLACALWLLHPYMVSTTLYVVQRMAQLATLFCLAGITLYLSARLQLAVKPRRAYLLMTAAVGAGTVLAVLSKENGALLPLLILVIEYCLPKSGKPALWWRAVFLWLPSIAISVMLARYIDFSDNPWPNRSFNQVERLLTEGRIVCEYLLHLWVPRIEGNGLYQDGYVVSRSLLEPISTLWALLFLAGLLGFAFAVQRKAPVITLAILFFFAAHLMESTVVGLELYFEHRNHLAALFLFLPAVYYGVKHCARHQWLVVFCVLVLVVLASMTWLRASLWSSHEKLELYWAQSATNSPRAVNSMAAFYVRHGQNAEAKKYLQESFQRLPDSPLLAVNLLFLKYRTETVVEQDFIDTAHQLARQKFDAQALKAVRTLVEGILGRDSPEHVRYALTLLNILSNSPTYHQQPAFVRLVAYLQGKAYLYLGDKSLAYDHYFLAMDHYQEVDAVMVMVAEMATAGAYKEALALLEKAEVILAQQKERYLKRSRSSYENEISHIKQVLVDMGKNDLQGVGD